MTSSGVSSREKLVVELRNDGISDERVLAALGRVPRDQFVSEALHDRAYENVALPIGEGQTISQPYVVAAMVQALALTGRESVLEVGTGSGYGAAVLAEVAAQVISVELRAELASVASARLRRLRYGNVTVLQGDGSLGWPGAAPYDAISVTACAPEVPRPLLQQLRNGGRLVAPIGPPKRQHLILFERADTRLHARDLGQVRFVPLLGVAGFQLLDQSRRN